MGKTTPVRLVRRPSKAAGATRSAPHAVSTPRSLAAEVGIIVLGVLIALAAQQAADVVRWRMDVAEMRRALNEELVADAAQIRAAQRQGSCNVAHFEALGAWARGELAGSPNGQFRGQGGAPWLNTSVWEVAKTGQVAAHMPLAERLAYARLYDAIESQRAFNPITRDTWRRLAAFSDKTSLTDADKTRLLEEVSQARNLTRAWMAGLPGILEGIGRRGVAVPPPLPAYRIPDDCRPSNSSQILGRGPP